MSGFRLAQAVVLVSAFLATGAMAQEAPKVHKKTKTTAPSTTTDIKKPDTTVADAGFPKPVDKDMSRYASADLRGKRAPEFKVEKWLTKEADRKDKVVLIDFWATWCGPCKKLIPELNDFQRQFKDDLVVIGVSDEEAPKVATFLKSTKVDYSMATDTKATMNKVLGIKGIPHVMIVSSDGVVRWQGFPGDEKDPLTADKIKQIIAADKAARAARTAKDTTKPTDKTTTPLTPIKK